MKAFFQRLGVDDRGVSVTEFGLIAPVVVVMMMGTMDAGHTLYMRSVLDGAIQELSRDSSLEDGAIEGKQQVIDERVSNRLRQLNKFATVSVKRRFYRNFTTAALAAAEKFTDTDGDGVCNNGEPYIDANLNNTWDSDGGDAGQGGAKDVSIVTVRVTYEHLFPVASLIGLPKDVDLSATTVLANQPYGEQGQYTTAETRQCND
jgi:Flp pilus assembly protein TadG